MSNKELVSVIMSAYNSQNTIERSINSLLVQTYKNIEILIIDDGSNDKTLKSIMKFQNEPNIKIFENKKNIGLTKSLNKLIKISNGKYIARQDSDDISSPNRIMKQVEDIKKYDLDFSSSRGYIENTKRKIPGLSYYLPYSLLIGYKNPFIHGTLMIKKSVIEEVGLYDERFYYAQDYKLMKELIDKGYRYRVIGKPLYKLNMINNISTNKKSEQKYYADCVKNNLNP